MTTATKRRPEPSNRFGKPVAENNAHVARIAELEAALEEIANSRRMIHVRLVARAALAKGRQA